MIELAMKRIKEHHEETCNDWFLAHHFQYEENVELRKENDRLRQRLRAANLKLLNNIGARGAPPTAAARLRSRTPIRRRARSADPGARGAPRTVLLPTTAGHLGLPLPDLLPPTPDNLMQVVEAQRVYIGQLRNEIEQMGPMPRAPIPSLMSMAIPGSPLTPFATTPGGVGALGAPPPDLLTRQETGPMTMTPGTPRGGKGKKGKPLMCPAGPNCRVPYCTYVHATS